MSEQEVITPNGYACQEMGHGVLRHLDVFSGIGGFALGLRWAGGFETVGFCEIDPFCRRVLAKHWPGVWIHDDVRSLTGDLVRERCGGVDLITAGFPCQQVSVAGRGEGIGTAERPTERSGLVWELLRIVREVAPARVLLENVPALKARGADQVLAALEGMRYTCWPIVVGADDVGAPHRRKRVWIVARLGLADAGSLRVADADGTGRGERRGAEPVPPQHAAAERGGPYRWPSRPGEPQHGWEAPRLAYAVRGPGNGRREQRHGGDERGDGYAGPQNELQGPTQSGVGVATDGLPRRLARRAGRIRREQLRALGNAVVPQVVEQIARAWKESP